MKPDEGRMMKKKTEVFFKGIFIESSSIMMEQSNVFHYS